MKFDRDNLLQYLQTIFPEKNVRNAEITRMGGMSNKNFRICLDGGSYVLRVPGNGSEGMVVRANEQFNSAEASKLGVTPPVRYFNPESGIKLTDYIEDAETLNAATIQRRDNVSKIVEIYRTVHNSHISLKNEFNIFREIEKYDELIAESGAEMYEGHEKIRPRIMQLEDRLNQLGGVDLKPCHNDAFYENFIKATDGTIYLIDWEYSGMNDPMADLAALFIEADFTLKNEDFVLDRYFKGKVPETARDKILIYKVLWDFLWAQWTVVKEANSDDFGEYGIDRFNRARKNLKLIYNEEN